MADEKLIEVHALKLIANDTKQLIEEWNRIMGVVMKHNLGSRTEETERALTTIKKRIQQNTAIVDFIKAHPSLIFNEK